METFKLEAGSLFYGRVVGRAGNDLIASEKPGEKLFKIPVDAKLEKIFTLDGKKPVQGCSFRLKVFENSSGLSGKSLDYDFSIE